MRIFLQLEPAQIQRFQSVEWILSKSIDLESVFICMANRLRRSLKPPIDGGVYGQS